MVTPSGRESWLIFALPWIVDEQTQEIDAALLKSNALRQSILKMAFSGKLVHQDPKDEPASALLERISEENDKLADKIKSVNRKALGRSPHD